MLNWRQGRYQRHMKHAGLLGISGPSLSKSVCVGSMQVLRRYTRSFFPSHEITDMYDEQVRLGLP